MSESCDGPAVHDKTPTCCVFRFPADVELVSVVRRFISDFCERTLSSRDAAERVALAAHELLENTVLYSKDGASTLRVEVETEGPRTVVALRTTNRASASNADELTARLREMQEVSDAAAYYQMVLRRSSRLRDQSGLGLARVFAEAESELSVELEADGRITVVAKTYLDAEERA